MALVESHLAEDDMAVLAEIGWDLPKSNQSFLFS